MARPSQSLVLTWSFLIIMMQHAKAFCPQRCRCKLAPNPTIDCSKANLRQLPEGLSHYKGRELEEVNFSNNPNLQSLKPGAFEGFNISVLKLSFTGLTKLQPGVFAGVIAVNTLYLDGNKMKYSSDENPLTGLEKSLEYMQLQGQDLKEIPHFIKHMHSLTEVDLSDNNIQELHDMSLHMIKARRVILQRNKMHTIARGALVSTKPKDLVDLSFNSITDISFLWDYCKAEKVDLSGNPIHCHCDLVVYRKAMPYPQVIGMCASPPALAGTSIMTEDFVTKASRTCKVGHVHPITCPAPHYRVNVYTHSTGVDSGAQTDLLTSGAASYSTGLQHHHYCTILFLITVFCDLICSSR